MVGHHERRIARLEATRGRKASTPPEVIVMRLDETQEQAVLRLYGPDGLPARHPGDVPHIFIRPVSPRPREPGGDVPSACEKGG